MPGNFIIRASQHPFLAANGCPRSLHRCRTTGQLCSMKPSF